MGFIAVKSSVGEAVIPEAALSVYEARGWKRTDPKAAPAPSPTEVVAPVPSAPVAKTSKES